jgi:hypothetical protein
MHSGATDHITGELEKLSVRNKYRGGDQIHMASGSGMSISYVGQTTFPTPSRNLLLNDILYVPKSKKNLVSVHRLTSENSIFIELHPNFFLIKDQKTRMVLVKGRCIGGLYPIPVAAIREVCSARRFSINTWHSRFDHPSFKIVEQVISNNNLLCSSDSIKESVCNACQPDKSHQLPYPRSTSISEFPLQLVYTNVWALHQNQQDERSIMLASLMTLANSPRFILSRLNLRCFRSFRISRSLSRGSLITKSLLSNLIWGGVSEA